MLLGALAVVRLKCPLGHGELLKIESWSARGVQRVVLSTPKQGAKGTARGGALSNLWITTCFFEKAALRCALYPQEPRDLMVLRGS